MRISDHEIRAALADADQRSFLRSLIAADANRMRLLETVRALRLPDCWVAAGFVRSAVWDHLHDRASTAPQNDVDVVWFDEARANSAIDAAIEARLKTAEPFVDWSVKNQARMHLRNGDKPYTSVEDAMSRWPETTTAVALRLIDDRIEILAPFGLGDLFAMIVRPTPAFTGAKLPIFQKRVREKLWLERWPRLKLVADGVAS
jgi:hypothetical protein